MSKLRSLLVLAIGLLTAGLLRAQQPCPGYSVVVNTPEDQLMLAINGADNPQEQIAALDKFAQEHADSKFLPCVLEYYTTTYLKMKDFDKAIEYGEKDLAGNYQSLNLMLNLLRAYVASTKVSDAAFNVIMKIPDQVKTEVNPARPTGASDADWEKLQQEAAQTANDDRAYAVYAFFQLLPRLTDPAKRLADLDAFAKAFPEAETKYAAQINEGYFQAYQMSNQLNKMLESGEKAVAADPNNLVVNNVLAFSYAFAVQPPNLGKAESYAKKAVDLAGSMKKPDGVSDEDFAKEKNSQLGMAHLTLGDVAFVRGSKTKKVAPAIGELKTAAELLATNPGLQAQALYYLGYAYEVEYPARHRDAIEVLSKASDIPGPYQGPARELLAKVRKAAKE